MGIGSKTAKSGTTNEERVARMFNNFQKNKEAQTWLKAIGYDFAKIKKLEAETTFKKFGRIKSDVLVDVDGKSTGISVKYNQGNGFGQYLRKWADDLCKECGAPPDKGKFKWVSVTLKKFAGQDGFQPEQTMTKKELLTLKKTRKRKFCEGSLKILNRHKKILISELDKTERKKILGWIKKNKKKIIRYGLRGKDKKHPPKFLLVTQHCKGKILRDGIVSMEKAINHFSQGDVFATRDGIIMIGKTTMQRKSGDGGAKAGQQLQLKLHPSDVFDMESCIETYPKT